MVPYPLQKGVVILSDMLNTSTIVDWVTQQMSICINMTGILEDAGADPGGVVGSDG